MDSLSPVSALLTDTGGTEFENNLEDWNDDGEPEFDSIDPGIVDLNLNSIRIRNSIYPDDDDDDLELSAQLPTSTGSSPKTQVAGTITFDPRTNCVVLDGDEEALDVPIPDDSNMERLDDGACFLSFRSSESLILRAPLLRTKSLHLQQMINPL